MGVNGEENAQFNIMLMLMIMCMRKIMRMLFALQTRPCEQVQAVLWQQCLLESENSMVTEFGVTPTVSPPRLL